MNVYDKLYNKNKQLIEIAIKKLENTKSDCAHTIRHTYDVVDYVKELLSFYPEADKEICIICAYWHDTGRMICDKGHPLESGKMLKTEMLKLNYSANMMNICYDAVINHGSKGNPNYIEGKILRDADILAYIGKRRWKESIEKDKNALNNIVERLPRLKTDFLKLDKSMQIFDRDYNLYIVDYLNKYFR